MTKLRKGYPDACPKPSTPAIGTRVRFTVNNLGGSERDDLGHILPERWDRGDVGTVAFPHENTRLAAEGWFYVEVPRKVGIGLAYVGVNSRMVEVLT